MYSRFGTEVVVVEFLDRIVPGVDQEIGTQFSRLLTKQGNKLQNLFLFQKFFSLGLKIMTKTKVLSGKTAGNGVEVVVQPVAVNIKCFPLKKNFLTGRQRTNLNRRCFIDFHW